jgi:rRNA maturation endonuclease Nob1
MERVLDTAALLHWPVERLVGGVCAVSQQEELQRLDASRSMLVETVELEWRAVPKAWLALATHHASETGDLPRLSDVDLDVLALALGLGARLVTDDYRMQNTFKHAGGVVEAVANRVSKAVWLWELRCTGCRDVTDVPADVERSKNRPAGECKRCGSPMLVKRRRAP